MGLLGFSRSLASHTAGRTLMITPPLRLRPLVPSSAAAPLSLSHLFSTRASRCFLAVSPPAVPEFNSSSCFESEENVFLRVLMPWVAMEDVEARFEGNKVMIHALRKKQAYDEANAVHVCDFGLWGPAPLEALKLSEMKAEMNNGILKVVIPKAPNWRQFLRSN